MATGFTVTSVNQTQDLRAGKLTEVVTAAFELDNEAGSGSATVDAVGDWRAALELAVATEAASMLAVLSM